jgi:hypothetical protein
VTSNAVKTRELRAQWTAIKTAAAQQGPTLLDGLAKIALHTWATNDAGTKLSEDRSTREAFVASLVGAAVVDTTIDKLAEDGAYTVHELEFLRDLNAEAALRDLSRFQKSASYGAQLLAALKAHPAAVGAVGGGLAGGAFGAYADDENRTRGALRFGLPGVAMGAMLGHGAGQLQNEMRDTKRTATEIARDAELHAARLKLMKAQTAAAARANAGRRR